MPKGAALQGLTMACFGPNTVLGLFCPKIQRYFAARHMLTQSQTVNLRPSLYRIHYLLNATIQLLSLGTHCTLKEVLLCLWQTLFNVAGFNMFLTSFLISTFFCRNREVLRARMQLIGQPLPSRQCFLRQQKSLFRHGSRRRSTRIR